MPCAPFPYLSPPSNILLPQIQTFRNTKVPVFIAEYGSNAHSPRLFNETTALYSPPMNRIFSGGCAYEFWQAGNRYGLVELVEHGNDKRRLEYTQDSYDDNKVAERRETERGTLLVFHDFVNYKAKLAEIGGIEVDTGDDESPKAEEDQRESDTEAGGEWQAGLSVPESCVDWSEIERSLVR